MYTLIVPRKAYNNLTQIKLEKPMSHSASTYKHLM